MSDQETRRWAGAFGIASSALFLLVLVIYAAIGASPRAEDAASFTDYVTRNNRPILTVSLVYALSAACFLVFLPGFRHLIRQARSDYDWVAGLVFGAGLVNIALGLVGLVFIGGAALDSINHKPDPTIVSTLGEGSTLALFGIGLIMATLFMAAVGYAILGSGVLPRWSGWLAYVAAVLDLVAVPAVYAGSDPNAFYSADGYVGFLGDLAYLVWLFSAGILMLMKREAVARAPVYLR